MARFLVTVKRQEPISRSVITASINIEAENELNASFAAEGMGLDSPTIPPWYVKSERNKH